MVDYREGAQQLVEQTAALNRLMARTAMREFWKGEPPILFHLRDCGHSTPGALSEAMEISTARVAVTLNALEEKGLISRRMDPSDRRKIVVTLTESGEVYVRQLQENLICDTETVLRSLGEHDTKEYLRIVGRMTELIEKQVKARGMSHVRIKEE